MDHFKRRLIPSSPFSRDLKSILINHLFGNKETEVKSIKQFIRGLIEKMKEVQEIAEKARAIGWIVGLSPQTTIGFVVVWGDSPTRPKQQQIQLKITRRIQLENTRRESKMKKRDKNLNVVGIVEVIQGDKVILKVAILRIQVVNVSSSGRLL